MNIKYPIFAIALVVAFAVIIFNLNEETIESVPESAPEEFKAADAILETGSDAFAITYNHTVPGEYSEVLVTAKSFPGDDIQVELTGPDNQTNTKTLAADENGVAYFSFRIYQFGSYYARTYYNNGEATHGQSITVE